MRQGANLNRIQLHGRVGGEPVISHTNHGVEFFRFPLVVCRLSGTEDRLNVMVPRPLLERQGPVEEGRELTVWGEVRTFNNRSGVGSRLVISAFARALELGEGEDCNQLELTGTLCKPPSLRATPLGRTICDMILAVNRRYGRADYLPCIAWGSLAHRCGDLEVGDRVHLCGRLQSRCYTKTVGEQTEERTAFEVSVMTLSQADGQEIE